MEVTDLHVGKQLNVVSNLPGGIPGPPNLAQGTGAAAIPEKDVPLVVYFRRMPLIGFRRKYINRHFVDVD